MILKTEYAKRRRALLKQLDSASLCLLPAAKAVIRNGDTYYPYRPQSDFYYLTGFDEPEACLVLAPKHQMGEMILFNRPKDRAQEQWDGPCLGQRRAVTELLFDAAYPIQQFKKYITILLAGRNKIYCALKHYAALEPLLREHLPTHAYKAIELIDVTPLIHEQRLFKSPAEIQAIQKAVAITVAAHKQAMIACKPGMNECELDALLTGAFKQQGALHVAYSNIVASGKNACTLHYVNNNQRIKNGDLVLIDAGAEYQYYAADITRTFPANGRFSKEQRALYTIVLAAQLAGIRAIKPGIPWSTIQKKIVSIITAGLKELGILKGNHAHLIKTNAYRSFYMHGSGHWLGLDVHDVGAYRHPHSRILKPGMVLTVEPGLYITNPPHVHKRWHHIGIRIEDDCLVTQQGCRVLSAQLPKTIDDIEAMMTN